MYWYILALFALPFVYFGGSAIYSLFDRFADAADQISRKGE